MVAAWRASLCSACKRRRLRRSLHTCLALALGSRAPGWPGGRGGLVVHIHNHVHQLAATTAPHLAAGAPPAGLRRRPSRSPSPERRVRPRLEQAAAPPPPPLLGDDLLDAGQEAFFEEGGGGGDWDGGPPFAHFPPFAQGGGHVEPELQPAPERVDEEEEAAPPLPAAEPVVLDAGQAADAAQEAEFLAFGPRSCLLCPPHSS